MMTLTRAAKSFAKKIPGLCAFLDEVYIEANKALPNLRFEVELPSARDRNGKQFLYVQLHSDESEQRTEEVIDDLAMRLFPPKGELADHLTLAPPDKWRL